MIIDGHHHLWYDIQEGDRIRRYFPWRQGWEICMMWAYTGTPPFNKDAKAFYPRQLLRMSDYDGTYTAADLEYHKIDATTIFPVDYDLNFGSTPPEITWDEKHTHAGELERKYTGKFLPYVQIDPRRTGALELMQRAFEEYGKFYALKLIPGCGFYPWDPEIYPLYEYCIDRDIPVAFCIEAVPSGYRYSRFCDPMHLADTMAEFRDMRVIQLHSGMPFMSWFEKCCHVAQHVNAFMEMDSWFEPHPGQGGTGPNIYDDPDGVIRMLTMAKKTAGAHKIIWGTDLANGPSYTKETASIRHKGWRSVPDWIKKLPENAAKLGHSFTPEETDWIVGDTIARVLGIKKDPAWNIPDKFGWRYRFPSPNRNRTG